MKTLKILAVIAVIGIAISTFAINEVMYSDKKEGYAVGDVTTDFSLRSINGQMVSLADFEQSKGFIIIFTCNRCPYSVIYEDRIIALDKKYRRHGYPVIAINPDDQTPFLDDNFTNMKVHAAEKSFTFPYLIDAQKEVYAQFGVTKTPHVFILEKTVKGNVVRYIGAIDNNYKGAATGVTINYVRDALDALLLRKQVEVEMTKAIGCNIKGW